MSTACHVIKAASSHRATAASIADHLHHDPAALPGSGRYRVGIVVVDARGRATAALTITELTDSTISLFPAIADDGELHTGDRIGLGGMLYRHHIESGGEVEHALITSAIRTIVMRSTKATAKANTSKEATGDGTEYAHKQAQLAVFLHELVYGPGTWERADADTAYNYLLDGDDILRSMPHLLSGPERDRLETIIPAVAI
ncbi:hypothetical protein [Arthrobacter castelli]|uniref:hypothetical protein n=1 Tax=Arthrobacter castelli TaxID=271431 RepID=UPI0004173E1D|nr:hypothetical protein [Arthrobacter castelli]